MKKVYQDIKQVWAFSKWYWRVFWVIYIIWLLYTFITVDWWGISGFVIGVIITYFLARRRRGRKQQVKYCECPKCHFKLPMMTPPKCKVHVCLECEAVLNFDGVTLTAITEQQLSKIGKRTPHLIDALAQYILDLRRAKSRGGYGVNKEQLN